MNSLRLLILSLAIPALAHGAVDPDRKVTFSEPAGTADRILKDLGAAAGVSLRAAASTGKDMILISVKDVTLSSLMQKIAEVENASWEAEGEGFRLGRSDAQRQADRDRERANMAERYRDGIKKISDQAAALPAVTDSFAKGLLERAKEADAQGQNGGNSWQLYSQVSAQAPAARLLIRLIPNLRAEDLADIQENGRVVFSDNPNRMQYRLPGNASAAIEAFVREQDIVAKAGQGMPVNNNYWNLRSLSTPLKSRPSKILLVVTKQPMQGTVECSLEILDNADHVLGSANQSVGVSPFADLQPDMTVKPKDGEKPMELSAESKALRARFKTVMGGGRPTAAAPELSPALRAKLMDPVQNDLLSFTPSEAIIGWAHSQNANLVAAMSDTTAVLLFPFSGDALMPSQIPPMLKMADEQIETKDGWMTLVPFNPDSARINRCDRVALAQMLRSMTKNGKLTIDDAAGYAVSSQGVQFDIVATLNAGILDPTALASLDPNKMSTLRFYGGMTPTQRQMSNSNTPIPFTSLSPIQRQALNEMVFGANSRLNNMRAMAIEEGQTPTYPTNDATEMLPNGLPANGSFTLRIENEMVVIPAREGGPGMYENGMTANDLAWHIYAQEHPDVGGSWASRPDQQVALDSLRTATRSSVNLHFDLAPQVAFDTQLQQLTADPKTVAFADLPDQFKKDYQRTADSYKNMKWGPGSGGTGTPPPPRS